MSGTVLYLSGPMTGYADLNFPAFTETAARLRGLGYTVVSPHEAKPDSDADWSEWLRRDLIDMLTRCNAFAIMPGSESSRGARLERCVAEALEWPVESVETWVTRRRNAQVSS